MHGNENRGFTLLLVMLVLIAMSIVVATAATLGATDASSAGARTHRAQALVAAETGMGILTMSRNATTIEGLVDSMNGAVTRLPEIDTDGDGVPEHRPAFVVRKGQDGDFVVEGQIRDRNDNVIGFARLAGRATASEGGDEYGGQKGGSPRGNNVIDERDVNARQTRSPL